MTLPLLLRKSKNEARIQRDLNPRPLLKHCHHCRVKSGFIFDEGTKINWQLKIHELKTHKIFGLSVELHQNSFIGLAPAQRKVDLIAKTCLYNSRPLKLIPTLLLISVRFEKSLVKMDLIPPFTFWTDGVLLTVVSSFGLIGTLMSVVVLLKPR